MIYRLVILKVQTLILSLESNLDDKVVKVAWKILNNNYILQINLLNKIIM